MGAARIGSMPTRVIARRNLRVADHTILNCCCACYTTDYPSDVTGIFNAFEIENELTKEIIDWKNRVSLESPSEIGRAPHETFRSHLTRCEIV